MERLTNIGSNGEIWITDNDETRRFGRKEAVYMKLAEYEDFEEIFRAKMTDTACEFLKDKEEFGKWLDRNKWIAKKCDEYARAEEQGLLLKLPCKVGDTVYIIAPKYRDCSREQCDSYDSEQFLKTYCKEFCPNGFKGIGVLETVVEYIEINNNDIRIMTKKGGLRNIDTIFLTQAEAEQKLKEMESD